VTGFLWGVLGSICTFIILAALGDMVSKEVRDRLDHLPHAILRLAARRLDAAQRVTVYEDEWLPELSYILKGDEARPITRLFHGTRYALGILANTRRIARHLRRPAPEQPKQTTPIRQSSSTSSARPVIDGSMSLRELEWLLNDLSSTNFSRWAIAMKGRETRLSCDATTEQIARFREYLSDWLLTNPTPEQLVRVKIGLSRVRDLRDIVAMLPDAPDNTAE
jgi:hypothetical protein